MIVSAIVGLSMFASTAMATIDKAPQYEELGTFKVTEYCSACNEGSGTSTGTPLYEGIVASDPTVIPYGTTISINGTEYIMADYCGNAVNVEPTIDVYKDWGDGCCHCSESYYSNVYVKRENNK